MLIKHKIVLGLFSILGISLMLNLLAYEIVLRPSFLSLEDELVQQRVELTRMAFNSELQDLLKINADFSHRDASYAYMQTQEPAYIDRYFMHNNFAIQPVSVFYIYDKDLNILVARAYDLTSGEMTAIEGDSAEELLAQHTLLDKPEYADGISDFHITKDGQVLLLTMMAIKKRHSTDLGRGYVVVGRLLDAQLLKKISMRLGFDIKTLSVSDAIKQDKMIENDKSISMLSQSGKDNTDRNIHIRFFNNHKEPLFWLQTTFPKEITLLGSQARKLSILATLVIASLMIVFLFFVFQRYVFTPTQRLTKSVVNIRSSLDQSARLNIKKHDEIGMLAHEFNSLLDKLEQTHKQLLEDYLNVQDLSQKLNYQATHDSLTGLVNRCEFENRLQRVMDGVKRQDDSTHVVAYIDLDKFKLINDSCGHEAGDKMLKYIAVKLRSKVRKRDTLARVGGDEFAVLMEHCTIDNAVRVAKGIIEELMEFSFKWNQHSFNTGLSMGLFLIDHTHELSEIIKKADAACYIAKQAGGNNYHIYRVDDENKFNQNTKIE